MKHYLGLIVALVLGCQVLPALALVNPVTTNLLVEDWMAEIYVVGESETDVHFLCKGALINSQWILTSGYCPLDPFKAYDAADTSAEFAEYRIKLGKTSELLPVGDFQYSNDYSLAWMKLNAPTSKTPIKLDTTASAASLLNKEVYILSTETSPIVRNTSFNPGTGPRMDCSIDGLLYLTSSSAPYTGFCYILAKPTVGTRLYKTTAKVIDPEATNSPNSSLDKLGGFDKSGARLYLDFRTSASYACNEDLGSPILVDNADGSRSLVGVVAGVGTVRALPLCSPILYNKFSALAYYKVQMETTMMETEFSELCPSAPTIKYQYLNGNKIRIYWNAVEGATGYKIHYSTKVGYQKIVTLDLGTKTEVTTPLESNVDYTLALSSYNAMCASGLSSQRTVGF